MLCMNLLFYKGNATNMMIHLPNHHKIENRRAQEKEKVTGATTLQPSQHTIEHSSELTSPIPKSSAKWKTLINLICYCIIKDMLPINTNNDTTHAKQGILHLIGLQ